MYVLDSLLTGNWETLKDSLNHLILPAVSLGVTPLAAIARMVRGSMLDVLGADYVRSARAKGLRQRAVVFRHALRNALIPVVTQIGLILASLLGGAVFVEWVFSWNGIGRYAVSSLAGLDYNPVMAVTIIVATIYVLINLVVDVAYTFLDPRIRYD
jgi:peptide/nickel transport system permease protein